MPKEFNKYNFCGEFSILCDISVQFSVKNQQDSRQTYAANVNKINVINSDHWIREC